MEATTVQTLPEPERPPGRPKTRVLLAVLATSWSAGIAGRWLRSRCGYCATSAARGYAREAEALNFNLSMLLYAIAAVAIGVVVIGATALTSASAW